MKRKLLIALGILAAGIGAVCIIASTKPDEMSVSRSILTTATPEAVFKIVNDFRRWDEWSPWSKLDPAMTKKLEGPAEGVGAKYSWSGNMEVGEGHMQVVTSRPSELVGIRLSFVSPMPGDSDITFTFAPEAGGTRVTWGLQSPQPFIGKVMSVFMDTEKMCGDQFQQGLEALKKIAETQPGT